MLLSDILVVQENPKKAILWAISAFCIFQKKRHSSVKEVDEVSDPGSSVSSVASVSLSAPGGRREEGMGSRAWTFS